MFDPWIFSLIASVILLTALAWKWNLPISLGFFGGVGIGLLAGICMKGIETSTSLSWPFRGILGIGFIIAWTVALLSIRFYRNPNRTIPEESGLISPADGIIRYVHRVSENVIPISIKKQRQFLLQELTKTELLKNGCTLIGIEMRIIDVHVNRAPISGQVLLVKQEKGSFLSLREPESLMENERVTTVIQHDDLQVGVVQIASRLVRRILSYVSEGETVSRGQRIGMITFGSQVDVLVPIRPSLKILVEPGQKVKAGETLLISDEDGNLK